MQNVTPPSTDEAGIEQAIQDKGLNAPRLTPKHIDGVIVSAHYFTAWEGAQLAYWGDSDPLNPKPIEGEPDKSGPLGTLTFCVLVLKNGFTMTGESACASPANFDAQIGRDIAYKNARQKVLAMEGYLLKQNLFQSVQPPHHPV